MSQSQSPAARDPAPMAQGPMTSMAQGQPPVAQGSMAQGPMRPEAPPSETSQGPKSRPSALRELAAVLGPVALLGLVALPGIAAVPGPVALPWPQVPLVRKRPCILRSKPRPKMSPQRSVAFLRTRSRLLPLPLPTFAGLSRSIRLHPIDVRYRRPDVDIRPCRSGKPYGI